MPNEEESTAARHSALGIRHFPIAYVAGQFPLRSETFVWREVNELRRRGWTVHTFGLHAPGEETPAELRELRESTAIVYPASGSPTFGTLLTHPLATTRGLADALRATHSHAPRDRLKLVPQAAAGAALGRELRRLGVRHVHAHFAHAPASVAMYAARDAGIPFSFTGHANDLFHRRQALRLKLRRAAFVACISHWHRNLYQSICPRPDADYPIVRCGVDTDAFAPRTTPTGDALPHVATVCRLVEKKGVDLLLRAIARLRQLRIDLRLTVGGDGPLRTALEAMTRELSLGNRVTFAGPLDASQVRTLLGTADLFALPCRIDSKGDRDGIPVVLMEAMACGLPVVSGDLPAIRELVIDEKTGLLVKPDDVEALAAALAKVMRRDSLSVAIGNAAREWVVEEFSLKRNVDRIECNFIGVRTR